MKHISLFFYTLLFIVIPGMASCKNNTADVKQVMQTAFKQLFGSLQQQNFKTATTYMSPELIKAMHSSEGQVEQLLAANFGNDSFLHIGHRLQSVTVTIPNEIVERDDKSYAVLHVIITAQLMFDIQNENDKEREEDIDLLKSLVIATYGKRLVLGEVTYAGTKATLNIKENRLVAAIYDTTAKKTTFALSEKFMKSFYEDFLPMEIIEEMKEQL